MISNYSQVNESSMCEQLTVTVTIPNHEQICVDLS